MIQQYSTIVILVYDNKCQRNYRVFLTYKANKRADRITKKTVSVCTNKYLRTKNVKEMYNTPPRNSGGIPYVSTRFSLSMEMSRLTRDGTAETVLRDQILRRERGQRIIIFPVQLLTTSRIGNLTRLIHTLAICVTIHTYICMYVCIY